MLGMVVALARWAEVVLAGRPGGVRHGVVDLAGDGLSAAAGRAAAGRAGANEVLQLPAWDVTVLTMGVIAGSPGDRLGGRVQLGQEGGEPPQTEGRRDRRGRAGAGARDGIRGRRRARWPRLRVR